MAEEWNKTGGGGLGKREKQISWLTTFHRSAQSNAGVQLPGNNDDTNAMVT